MTTSYSLSQGWCAMGYDLRITRAAHWSDNSGHEIAQEEWLAVVRADPEIKIEMDWRRGNIGSKNPDGAIIAKMIRLAELLKAKVQGDDGEIYLPDGRVQLPDGCIAEGQDWRIW